MNITAIAPWFGGKRTMAKSIVEAIGPHSAYWEPFCGSMAVLMAKPVAPAETVNDLHNDLINLAWTVQHEKLGPSLYRHLRRVLAHQSELERARLDLAGSFIATPGAPDLGRAADYFIASWLGISGLSGTKAAEDKRRGIARRFTSNGGSPSVRFAGAVESIPHWRRRMRRVFVLQTCGLEICEKVEDKDGTVIYVDPPYVEKSIEYIHDFKPADHERLAKALARFEKTRVVVSYYEHAWLKELYPPHRWESIDCTMRKAMNNPNKATERRSAPEVLLVNSRKSATLFR